MLLSAPGSWLGLCRGSGAGASLSPEQEPGKDAVRRLPKVSVPRRNVPWRTQSHRQSTGITGIVGIMEVIEIIGVTEIIGTIWVVEIIEVIETIGVTEIIGTI